MAKSNSSNKLQLRFIEPENIGNLKQDTADTREFARYFELEASFFDEEKVNTRAERQKFYEGESIPLPEGADEETLEKAKENWRNNITAALKLLEEKKTEQLSIQLIQQLHGLLAAKTEASHSAGILRASANNLFANVEPSLLLPEGNDLRMFIDQMITIANSEQEPVIKAFSAWYIFMVTEPFTALNMPTAMLTSFHILNGSGYHFFGLLAPEKYIFSDPLLKTNLSKVFAGKSYKEKLTEDLTQLVEIWVAGMLKNITAIKAAAIEKVKLQLGFKELEPRQKNSLNFWLELGFFKYNEQLAKLTQRQQDIMLLMAKHGSLSNRELVYVFTADRKSIQEDFNVLNENRLIEQRGGGRGLRYFLDFKLAAD